MMTKRSVLIVGIVCLLAVFVESNIQTLDCASVLCEAVECEGGQTQTKRPPGQCCQQCTGPENGNAGCTHGDKQYQHLQVFWDKCNKCTCNNGDTHCTKKVCVADECKGQGKEQNEYIDPQNKDPCVNCLCRDDGTYACYYMACLLRYCPNGYMRKNNECCPRCRKGPCKP